MPSGRPTAAAREYPDEFVHGHILARLAHQVFLASEACGIGVLRTRPTYMLDEDPPTVRGPDIGFWNDERIHPGGLLATFGGTAPDLAIELITEHNPPSAIHARMLWYLSRGTRLVWIIDPVARLVTIYPVGGAVAVQRTAGVLDGGDVLPALRIELADIFRA